jgi:hypothetical protein
MSISVLGTPCSSMLDMITEGKKRNNSWRGKKGTIPGVGRN